jgi:hypothetical protein
VSSLFSAPSIWLVPFASAAINKARLVIDFDPGGATEPRSGRRGGKIVRAMVIQ